jgi:hypothetical protein
MSTKETHLVEQVEKVRSELRLLIGKMVGASQVSLDQRMVWAERLNQQVDLLREVRLGIGTAS